MQNLGGIRKPSYQNGTEIRTVTDLMLLGILSIEEGRSLLRWLHSLNLGPLGITGISRGGLIAAIVAAITPLPLAVVPFIPTHSGGVTFTEGLIQLSCEWEELNKQLERNNKHGERCSKQMLFEILEKTNITNFPPPMRPDAAICISAKKDGLVSPWSTEVFRQYWPGSEIRMINGGHVSAIALRLGQLRQAVRDSLVKLSI
ncbi:MAG: alpha/beta hydrolase family protein [Oligoflexales bacterium]|nr:alpha/beta hydrolase family protein [Oligoflexales bacterium]